MQRMISKSRRRLFSESGFTLIELLIGLAIFSVGIMAVSMMQVRTTGSTTTAGHVSYNNAVATDCLERLMRLPYTDDLLTETSDYDDVEGIFAEYDTPPHFPAMNADFIDNDRDGIIDEGDEEGPIRIRWWVKEIPPVAGTDIYNYKTVLVRVDRGIQNQPGHLFVTLQRNIPNIVGD